MQYLTVGHGGPQASRIVLGCMRIASKPASEVEALIGTALEQGVNHFDHADIYGRGESERVFGAALKNLGIDRSRVILQTKCGIRKLPDIGNYYDFSREHIIGSVDESLSRLGADYVDLLLLHRPDALMDVGEVARAFEDLRAAGKVRRFGVSNFSVMQCELLRSAGVEIAANQLQFSLMHAGLADAGMYVNLAKEEGIERGGDLLAYCRLQGITPQAWSPLYYGFFEGIFVGNERFPTLNAVLDKLAERYGATPAAIAFAWILRHPAAWQVIAGTTNAGRLADLCRAAEITLTREEWYELYLATGKKLP